MQFKKIVALFKRLTNPNKVLPAKDANEEEDGGDEPGQDDHHDHLVDRDDDYEDNGHDKDLVSCAPCSIPGGQLHRTKPAKGDLIQGARDGVGEDGTQSQF